MFLSCLFSARKQKLVTENVFDHNVGVDGLRPTKKGGNLSLHNKIVLHAYAYRER